MQDSRSKVQATQGEEQGASKYRVRVFQSNPSPVSMRCFQQVFLKNLLPNFCKRSNVATFQQSGGDYDYHYIIQSRV